jgi:hypothetical protein
VFAAVWVVIFLRIEPHDVGPPPALDAEAALEESEAGALAR